MPHVVLDATWPAAEIAARIPLDVVRWRNAVLKTDMCWLRSEGEGVLVEGVVVEHTRPLKPVAVITPHEDRTVVRLWPTAPVERTPAVQRWLALLAGHIGRDEAVARATNIGADALEGLDLE